MMPSRLWVHGSMVLAILVSEPDCTRAQDRAPVTKDEAVLSVDGIVREVFQSPRRDRVDYIVQIEVKRSESLRAPRTPARVTVPAPGDMVYVHASQPQSTALSLGGQGTGQPQPRPAIAQVVPAERSQVRAYLRPKANGGWEGAGSDWFELTARDLAAAGAADASPPAIERAPGSVGSGSGPGGARDGRAVLQALGLTGEAKTVQGKFIIRVSSVERGGASQHAGLEPGDIIIGANDKALTGLEQLEALSQRGGRVNLVLLDVNTGKTVRVPVDLPVPAGQASPGRLPVPDDKPEKPVLPGDAANPNSRAPARSLGVSAEPVTIGQRTAMKVVGVQPESPGQKAGLEPGDIIVAANGVPITGAEALSAVVRKSGATLSLTVRDTRTGKDTRVDVKLGGDEPGNLAPPPADPAAPTGAGKRLGAVTEVVFYDVDPAVKVTEVEPGSAAALAGIEPGDIIVEANGSPVLHPKELDELVRKSGPTLKLVVVNPRTRQKSSVAVKLGADR